ncbi:alpha/beta hydrolase [Gordonia phthalatica]|uniref:Alpha/beta hydrolase n=1 Tax=Gordonia phthalatica TaxID=1136941 RepID=A0A0N9NCZ9_9ACTN|nr:alpha/beta fold hydrolase [Gordonia phthalatica]ALG85556.1 alpha/beta hydrolase [Gordonia phthalatica]
MPDIPARDLHVHLFGPDDPDVPHVLAVHGLTGHGQRWGRLADAHLPGVRVVAPDLLGHGHSPWEPPWGIADNADALSAALDRYIAEQSRPVVILAHSFGCAISLELAARRPDDVAGLVLLDPAQGLDAGFARTIAESAMARWGNTDAEDAKAAKRMEGWGEVPAEILDAEVVEHLIPTADGRVSWRVSAPAVATAWSEMAGRFRLPPVGVPTHVVIAGRVDPPFVRPAFLAACADQRADSVTVHRVDTEHMVPFLVPELCADIVKGLLR